MISKRYYERGVVSIFVVIFTALLITIVTTSFLQIMLRNQQQASNNDLSQSAYDSALAGVEDAKRALIKLKECKDDLSARCSNLRSTLVNNGSECNVLDQAGIRTFVNGEVKVGDPTLNQAYSCVKINVNTDSYQGVLDANGAVLIPLQSVGDTNDISSVRISWFMQDDNPGNVPQFPTPVQLLSLGGPTGWTSRYPSLMRTQLIQFQKGAVNINDFDTVGNNNARTMFLYPDDDGSATYDFATADTRMSAGATNSPFITQCVAAYTLNGGYACSVDIAIPSLGAGTREAYLHLTSLYNASHYKVQLLGSSGGVIDFDNVQPEVDSTGRASDLFRRVKARIAVSGGIPQTYPDALSIGKSLCKDFFVTNDYYENDTDATECRADQ